MVRAFCGIILAGILCFLGCSTEPRGPKIAEMPQVGNTYYADLAALVKSEVEANPADTNRRIRLARYHQLLKWPGESDANIQAALQLAPGNPGMILLAADYYIHRNEFEKSWMYAQQADKLGLVHPSLSLIKARYHYSIRNFAEAARYLEQYFQVGGKLPEAFGIGAELELQQSDTIRALEILENGFRLSPANKTITSTLIKLYFSQGKHDRVIETLDNFNKTNTDTSFRSDLLNACFFSGSYERAGKLAASWPDLENGLLHYGNLFLQSSMPDSASFYADKLLQHDSLSVQGYLLKARYYRSKGRLSDAYQSYARVLALDSTHQIALGEKEGVSGKIAYLRKLKQEQATMPVFDLIPKKSDK